MPQKLYRQHGMRLPDCSNKGTTFPRKPVTDVFQRTATHALWKLCDCCMGNHLPISYPDAFTPQSTNEAHALDACPSPSVANHCS